MSVSLDRLQNVGYGLMNFTWVASRKFTQVEFDSVLKKVLDGSKASVEKPLFLNGGEFYGIPDRYENLQLIGGFFRNYPDYADKVYLSIKAGTTAEWAPDTSPSNLSTAIDIIDEHLQPLYNARQHLPKCLDMFTLCRVGSDPIEKTMEYLKGKLDERRFNSICLSELSAETLKRALTVAKVDAVEIEFSLFHREAVENGLLSVCVDHSIPIVCYSPLGKGLLVGQKPSDLAADDMRHNFDKFNDAKVIEENEFLVKKVQDIANANGLSPAQVAVSWITTLSSKTRSGVSYAHLLPIPGSTNPDRQLDNLNTVELSEDVLSEIDAVLGKFRTAGHRYNKMLDQFTYK